MFSGAVDSHSGDARAYNKEIKVKDRKKGKKERKRDGEREIHPSSGG